jgi:hypothetical protein
LASRHVRVRGDRGHLVGGVPNSQGQVHQVPAGTCARLRVCGVACVRH